MNKDLLTLFDELFDMGSDADFQTAKNKILKSQNSSVTDVSAMKIVFQKIAQRFTLDSIVGEYTKVEDMKSNISDIFKVINSNDFSDMRHIYGILEILYFDASRAYLENYLDDIKPALVALLTEVDIKSVLNKLSGWQKNSSLQDKVKMIKDSLSEVTITIQTKAVMNAKKKTGKNHLSDEAKRRLNEIQSLKKDTMDMLDNQFANVHLTNKKLQKLIDLEGKMNTLVKEGKEDIPTVNPSAPATRNQQKNYDENLDFDFNFDDEDFDDKPKKKKWVKVVLYGGAVAIFATGIKLTVDNVGKIIKQGESSNNPTPSASAPLDPTTPTTNPSPVPSESITPSNNPSESVNPSPSPTETVDNSPIPTESVDPTPLPTVSAVPTPSEPVKPSPSPSEPEKPDQKPSESMNPLPTPNQSSIDEAITNACNTVYTNWQAIGSTHTKEEITEVIKAINGYESAYTKDEVYNILIDTYNLAITTPINNILTGQSISCPEVNVSSLIIGNKTGALAVAKMESYLNGCIKNPSNAESYVRNALNDIALVVGEGQTVDGMNVQNGTTTDPGIRLLWASLGLATNSFAITVDKPIVVIIGNNVYTQENIDNESFLYQVILDAQNSLNNFSDSNSLKI